MENNLAVLIDFENIAAGTEKEGLGRFDVEALIQRVKDKGRILLARSYADWGRFSRFKQSLLSSNVTMMELTSHGMQDKNRADIAMVVDALELAFTRNYIDTFVLVSGDSDFTPLVLKMRELNKRVIGIGTRSSTSRLLVNACDEFLFYESVVESTRTQRRPQRPDQPLDRDAAFELLVETIRGIQRENPDPPLASVAKSAMLRKSPDFSETDLGFPSFAKLLEAAQAAGKVKVIRDMKSGGYRVDLGSEAREVLPTNVDEFLVETASTFLPSGSDPLIQVLEESGFHPLDAPSRMALLEALVQQVIERRAKKRKVTLGFLKDDLRKALRRTHPDLSEARLDGVLRALLEAGQLLHRDGSPIRSPTAIFTLTKNAEQLNQALVEFYLAHLVNAGSNLSDRGLLADLFYGDAARTRAIEETLAWLASRTEEAPEDQDLDLEDLLEAGTGEASERVIVDESAFFEETPQADTSAPTEEVRSAEVVAESSDEAPKRKRKPRKRTKKDEEAAEAPARSDLDDLLESD